jgi:hypothetical protein
MAVPGSCLAKPSERLHNHPSTGKCKVVIKHYAMMAYGGGGVAPPHLISALDRGGGWSASPPLPLYPRGKTPGYSSGDRWAPHPVWTVRSREESPVRAGNRTAIAQPEARPYTD